MQLGRAAEAGLGLRCGNSMWQRQCHETPSWSSNYKWHIGSTFSSYHLGLALSPLPGVGWGERGGQDCHQFCLALWTCTVALFFANRLTGRADCLTSLKCNPGLWAEWAVPSHWVASLEDDSRGMPSSLEAKSCPPFPAHPGGGAGSPLLLPLPSVTTHSCSSSWQAKWRWRVRTITVSCLPLLSGPEILWPPASPTPPRLGTATGGQAASSVPPLGRLAAEPAQATGR